VLFADFELARTSSVEKDEPVTATCLTRLYKDASTPYYGDAVDMED
jgi:oligoendopeptidase F